MTSLPPSESRVKVGIRIRPLTAKEINQGGTHSLVAAPPSIEISQRQFTYDTVFDSSIGQAELYESVAPPLLQSFVDGYNSTIMAYGQTGSGKTFTMGSEAHVHPETSTHVGLIPRFISEIFHQMQQKKASSDKTGVTSPPLLDYNLSASFLEVYGEDVYDLLDEDRRSLPLREDSVGGVVITGLKHRSVSNPSDTLDVLHEGTMNRTTAATLMNLTSSRSHAVFTIYLSQVIRSNTTGVDVTSVSRFTFVDLAGSERMKKTGAEGERAREGIKINEGLLALGNVINALADDERLAKEKKIHVPYRQSKLTRLLQDALGGNSQTLFLACVSPSDTNVSETLSTLHYANRARNIRNAPTKNVDATAMELQRLHTLAHVLQCELIKNRFQGAQSKREGVGHIDSALLDRPDVEEYIRSIHHAASELSLKKEPFSLAPSQPELGSIQSIHLQAQNEATFRALHTLETPPSKTVAERFNDSFLLDVNPDEDMAILDHLLELQQQDHQYDTERKKNDERIKIMNGELEKEETMLLKIRNSLKAFQNLKRKYEDLMADVQRLESEKDCLANQLESAKTDPSIGCSAVIKNQLEKVELSLSRARRETRTHRQRFRDVDEIEKKCRVLERKIDELKQAKKELVRKQKDTMVRYRTMMEAKTKEVLILKRKDKVAGRKVSKLESEIQHHRNTLDKRQAYCTEISKKLKKTESHLLRLLTLRQRELAKRTGHLGRSGASENFRSEERLHHDSSDGALTREEWNCTRFVFNKMVWDKVNQAFLQNLYEDRMTVYSDTLRQAMAQAKRLKAARRLPNKAATEKDRPAMQELEENVADLELRLELLGSELSEIRIRMPEETKRSMLDSQEAVSRILSAMEGRVLRSMLLEAMSKLVVAETERKNQAESLDRKDAALMSFESEVESLTTRLTCLTKDVTERKLVSDSSDDPVDILIDMKQKNADLEARLHESSKEAQESISTASILKDKLRQSTHHHAEAQQKLKFLEASLFSHGGMAESTALFDDLQETWRQLGTDISLQEKEVQEIGSSIADTCSRKLSRALLLKAGAEKNIARLSHQLGCMRLALGLSQVSSSQQTWSLPLLKCLQKHQNEFQDLVTPYNYACARREKIIDDAIRLSEELEISTESLPKCLMALLQQTDCVAENASSENTETDGDAEANSPAKKSAGSYVEGIVGKEGKDFVVLPPRCVETSFLTMCEAEIEKLRVQKSELLIENREIQQKIANAVKEVHMSSDELVSNLYAVFESLAYERQEHLGRKRIDYVAKAMLSPNQELQLRADDSERLRFILDFVNGMVNYRATLSSALQSVVERAQRSLLDIVGQEVDASEAYASFHDALFRLPALSQDLSLACISEMEALVLCVETMTQSETEALSVVWEALDMTPSGRHNFWARVERTREPNEDTTPFDETKSLAGPQCESWIVEASQKASALSKELYRKLWKLEKIHDEVERLRSTQDSKSRILSLNLQVRILSSKLTELEPTERGKKRPLSQCSKALTPANKKRLGTQIKSKLRSQAKQLSEMLEIWEDDEGTGFETCLLSNDVQAVLREVRKPKYWKETEDQRNSALLNTVVLKPGQSKSSYQESSIKHIGFKASTTQLPRTRPKRCGAVAQSLPLDCTKDSIMIPAPSENLKNLKRTREESLRIDSLEPKVKGEPKRPRRGKKPLGPFGRILAEVSSPMERKEN